MELRWNLRTEKFWNWNILVKSELAALRLETVSYSAVCPGELLCHCKLLHWELNQTIPNLSIPLYTIGSKLFYPSTHPYCNFNRAGMLPACWHPISFLKCRECQVHRCPSAESLRRLHHWLQTQSTRWANKLILKHIETVSNVEYVEYWIMKLILFFNVFHIEFMKALLQMLTHDPPVQGT